MLSTSMWLLLGTARASLLSQDFAAELDFELPLESDYETALSAKQQFTYPAVDGSLHQLLYTVAPQLMRRMLLSVAPNYTCTDELCPKPLTCTDQLCAKPLTCTD